MHEVEDDRNLLEYLLRTTRWLETRHAELEQQWLNPTEQIRNQEIRILRLHEHLKDARRLAQILEEDSVRVEENRQKRSRQLHLQIQRTVNRVRHQEEEAAMDEDRRILTIAGGFAGGGASANARKRYSRSIMNPNTDSPFVVPGYSTVAFEDGDFKGVQLHDGDPLVVAVTMRSVNIHRALVDGGRAINVMYWRCLELLQIPQEAIKNYPGVLIGFTSHKAEVHGYLDFATTFEEHGRQKTVLLRYMVINARSAYDLILGRPALNDLTAGVSYPQLCMKFPLLGGRTLTIKEDQTIARKCIAESVRVQSVRDVTA